MDQVIYVDLKWVAKRYNYQSTISVANLARAGKLPGAFKIPPGSGGGRWKVDPKVLQAAWGGK